MSISSPAFPCQLATLIAATALTLSTSIAVAQVAPAQGYTPPDDTPKVNVGVTIFTNYVRTDEPTTTDSDGNTIRPSAFDVSRAYVNVTGNLSHLIAFRVTPDVSGHFATTVTGGATGEKVTTSYDGSLVYRLKYAYGQLNLDDWLPKGSWVRLGANQTPYLDFMEGIYRYRFQGTLFIEREGFLSSSDFGLSGHLAFPNNYGDLHLGVYNGDTYTKAEANDQKSFQIRGTLRPLPNMPIWKGLRLTGFYDADNYVKSGERNRLDAALTFEHKYVNLGADYIDVSDQPSAKTAAVKANGFDFWVTPRTTIGIEGFFRYDSLKPNKDVDAKKNRTIAGVSYWFKTEKAAAIFADYEHVSYDAALKKPNETRYGLHCLFNF